MSSLKSLTSGAKKSAIVPKANISEPSECGERYYLHSPTSLPKASTFLWNKKMLLQMNVRGFAIAKYMDTDVSQYSYAPNIEQKTFFQPEQSFYAHHPGRFFYMLDVESDELYSAPYEPVRRLPDTFLFSVGVADAIWRLDFGGITADLKVELAEDDVVEIWSIELKNTGLDARKLKLCPYFTIGFMSWMNQSARYDKKLNAIIAECVTAYQKLEDYPRIKELKDKTFLLCDTTPSGWETSRERFEGEGGLTNPDSIREGLSNEDSFYESPVGVVQYDVYLKPKDSQTFKFLFGPARTIDEVEVLKERYFGDNARCSEKTSSRRQDVLESQQYLQISSPDPKFDNFVNNWLPRQLLMHGDINRLTQDPQTRNYLQDNMGMSYLDPEVMKRALLRTLSQQNADGSLPDGILLNPKSELKYINQIPHTDHNIWLPICLEVYLNETADYEILDVSIKSANARPDATVAERITQAMDWLIGNTDSRCLSLISQGDWCDPMNMVGPKGKGVSGWLTIATAHALGIWSKILKQGGHHKTSERMQKAHGDFETAANIHLWDEVWYIRGISDEGRGFGKANDEEGRIFLNPQSWSILANIVSKQQQETLLKSIDEHLVTPYGPEMLSPPFTKMHEHIGRVTQKFPGSAENGSVYNHAAIFYIYSLYKIQDGDRAFQLLKKMLPGETREDLLRRGQLPIFIPNYYRGAYKRFPEMAGKSSQMFNTGTVSWYYRCVLEGLIGFLGTPDGAKILPCLPSGWSHLNVTRKFRGAEFEIKISRGLEKGMRINGERTTSNEIKNIRPGKSYILQIEI